MLQYATAHKINNILCEKIDRLTRNIKDASTVNDWITDGENRQIHCVKESFVLSKNTKAHENLVWDMKVAIARFYCNNLSEEVKKGQKEKISQGHLPSQPPLGYKTVGESGHKIHVHDKEKAPLMIKMFELYATGNYSIDMLVDVMHKEGLRTKRVNKLVRSRMASLLSDPFYIGKFRWNGELYEGKHDPLISRELFERVQNMLKKRYPWKVEKRVHTFNKLIKCGECGYAVTGDTKKGKYTYYNCKSKHKRVREHIIESQVIEYFKNMEIKNPHITEWIRKALKESHEEETAYYTTTLNELTQQHERLKKRLDRLYVDKLDGKISEESYERLFKQFAEEKNSILDAIKAHSNTSNKYFELGVKIFDLSQKAEIIYHKATPEKKRGLMQLVFESMTLTDGKLSVQYSAPFEVLSKAVRYTNSSEVVSLAEFRKKKSELAKKPFTTGKTAAFTPKLNKLLGG